MDLRHQVPTAAAVAWLALAGMASAQSAPSPAVAAPPASRPTAPAVDPDKLKLAHDAFLALDGAEILQANLNAAMRAASAQLPKTTDPVVQKHIGDINTYIQGASLAAFANAMADAERVYAENFSTEQLREILAFYQSPTGRVLQAKRQQIRNQMVVTEAPLFSNLQQGVVVHVLTEICSENACTPAQKSTLNKLTVQPTQP